MKAPCLAVPSWSRSYLLGPGDDPKQLCVDDCRRVWRVQGCLTEADELIGIEH